VLALADRQHGVITRAQLLDAGLSAGAVRHRLRTGRLHRVFPSVYAVGRPLLTLNGRWMAAVLACGPGAALSHLSAGALWGIWERLPPSQPHVSVPGGGGRRGPRGIALRRTDLQPGDVTVHRAIPVTALGRTLVDLALVLDDRRLRSAIRQAERLHRLDLRALRESVEHAPRSSVKHARLLRALGAYVPGAAGTEADAEMAFLEICAAKGLPAPDCQVPVGRYRADFMWQDVGLVVEIDDRQSHDGYVAFRDDRVRDRAMKALALEVLRFTRTEVLSGPEAVGREVAAAHAQRAPSGPPV
jgi:hypothetical protein